MTGKAPRIPVVVVFGPTAIGKTALAIALARACDGEIVSADSRQIYRQMDIGTAKPTSDQQAAARHHLIDIAEPDETLSAAQFRALATDLIDDIHRRGKLPIVAGGTGQYITALLEGWAMPAVAPDDNLRAELEAEAARDGAAALYTRLLTLDPAAADLIHPNNVRRVIRALEVIAITGLPFTAQRRKQPPPYRTLQFGLHLERERLYAQADARLAGMMAAGFADEVRHLLEQEYDRRLPSMSGLGYSQLAAHWQDGLPLAEAIEATRSATHDFIRRQQTWFRHHDNGGTIEELPAAALDTDAVIRWIKVWRTADDPSFADGSGMDPHES